MRTPFIVEKQLNQMPPASAKVLILLCDECRCNTVNGKILDWANSIGFSRAMWRRAVQWLVEAKLIDYQTSNCGFRVKIRHGSRFTWVPSYEDGRLRLASPRACKLLLAICRALDNATRSVRIRARTLAARLGRSIRTVQLALRELRERSILDSFRTGRSSWFSVIFAGQPSAAPLIAHRPDLLLRILSTTTRKELSTVLAHLSSRVEKIASFSRQLLNVPNPPHKRFLSRRLRRFGIDDATIPVLIHAYTADELNAALSASTDRTSPATFLHRLRFGRFASLDIP